MLVKSWMSKKPVTVDVDDSMHEAMKLLKQNHVSILPVMQKGKLVGVRYIHHPYKTAWISLGQAVFSTC